MKKSAEEVLLSYGVKPTPQRMVIAEFILNTESHPTAEEVMAQVENKLPVPLSRATVYNTLNTLVEAGVIQEVFTEPGAARYDANLNKHHHFVDMESGRIVDIPAEALPDIKDKLGRKFKVHGYQITFFGEIKD